MSDERFPKLHELINELKDSNLIRLEPGVLSEFRKMSAIVEWAYEELPFSVGDVVRYTKADKLNPASGGWGFKDQLKEAPLRVTDINMLAPYEDRPASWSVTCQLQYHPFYSWTADERPKTAHFGIPMADLDWATEDEMQEWLQESLKRYKAEQKQHEEKLAKPCKCCGKK